jgi:hypothetical protein
VIEHQRANVGHAQPKAATEITVVRTVALLAIDLVNQFKQLSAAVIHRHAPIFLRCPCFQCHGTSFLENALNNRHQTVMCELSSASGSSSTSGPFTVFARRNEGFLLKTLENDVGKTMVIRTLSPLQSHG